MSAPITIRLFLVNGEPEGLRVAEVSNWTGKALACPRSDFKSLLERAELRNSGIYFLTGVSPDSGRPVVYIGEAEDVRKRLPAHTSKDFWTQSVVFTVKDDSLTKAHVKYLEGQLIALATTANQAELMNSQASGARLSEPDEAEMSVYLGKLLQLLPILGLDVFRSGGTTRPNSPELICTIKGLVARGRRSSGGFTVYQGSQAVLKDRVSATSTKVIRKRLLDEGVLLAQDSYLEFSKDHEFSSPSAAAGVVRGGNTNGLLWWRTIDGTKLKDLELESASGQEQA